MRRGGNCVLIDWGKSRFGAGTDAQMLDDTYRKNQDLKRDRERKDAAREARRTALDGQPESPRKMGSISRSLF